MGKKTDLAVNRRRKATSGAATAYMSRNQALKKLQLRLADFRRICILKGIYPHEPRHPKKAGGATGSTAAKTYYYAKDINFLMHEPIVNKFREYKVHARKLRRAIGKSEHSLAERLKESRPRYTLDAIIRERFPTFIDAVRHLPDCLDMCFAYATMPASRRTPADKIALCRRLTVEFMLYVITSRSLRKVFVSIKGFYFEADICGELVRWRVPHSRAYERPQDVDFRILGTHVELYCPLLGFVNFRLFASVGLHYPPVPAIQNTSLAEEEAISEMDDRIAALTLPLRSRLEVDDAEADDFPADDSLAAERQKEEQEETKRIENLFGQFKFFLQREVDREQLTFVIRSCSGEVSWDRMLGPGSTYQESDERITHQVVDRGVQPTEPRLVSRYYVQPQWVFDCVNAKRVLPPEKYFPGVQLPPHLSPFVEEAPGEYVPPEKMQLDFPSSAAEQKSSSESDVSDDDAGSQSDVNVQDSDDSSLSDTGGQMDEDVKDSTPPAKNASTIQTLSKRQIKKKEKELKKSSIAVKRESSVTPGKVKRADATENAEREEKRLTEMMIPKKKQRLYRKIMHAKKKVAQEARILAEKRREHDRKEKQKKKKLTDTL